MSEHKWLTDQEVRLIELDASGRYGDGIDPGDVLRLIADRPEMRKLLGRLVLQQENIGEAPGIATCRLGRYCLYCEYEFGFDGSFAHHDDDCPIQQGRDMLEATK